MIDPTEACSPGQRWVSTTEPELGLGIVFEVANRRVVISFPAGDERRTYALDNAPLTRVRYRIADRIKREDGTEIIIDERAEQDGCLVYHGFDARGQRAAIHEIDLDSFVQFSRPLDRLFMGHIDGARRFRLRADTLHHHHRNQCSPAFGLLGPRVQLLPHQFYIADEVSRRQAPRVLLADEVGLGKTIEAGLIIHRQLLQGRAARVLLVVPDNLVHQWLVEMLRRFNLQFSIIDRAYLDADAEDDDLPDDISDDPTGGNGTDENPFESTQLALVPLGVFIAENDALEAALGAEWDLLVVDEAHHLTWNPDSGASPAYAAIGALAAEAIGVLLLTATPEQLGVSGHFARLALLDPHRYASLAAFLEEEERYGAVSQLVSALLESGDAPTPERLAQVRDYLGEERVSALAADTAEPLVPRLVRELLDHHGTGRVLFRNCRDNIAGFPERCLHTYALPGPTTWPMADDDVAAMLNPELAAGSSWVEQDPRAAWLASWLREHRGDKVLVICADAGSAQDLESWLTTRHGFRTAVFHEGMDLVQRDRAAAYFADTEDYAQALVCSEIGSEGRNFQFAHHLVLFDLPLNPDLLEQRIGRLDRIGQTHTVDIHVPCFADSAQAVLLRWLHEGVDAFERSNPAGATLFDEFGERLLACLRAPRDEAALDALITDTAARREELLSLLREGRDRLLELNSFDAERATTMVDAVEAAADIEVLREYMDRVFDEFGVEHEDHGDGGLIVHPGDHMACESFPGLPEGGLTVGFDRSNALSRDDVHFLTWEHPMVSGAMDMVLGGEFGNASFGVVKARDLTAGSVLIECLFAIVCPAPRQLRVGRFLPISNLRLALDQQGNDVTELRSAAWFHAAVRDVPRATAQKVVNRMRDVIESIAEQTTHFAEVSQEGLVKQALAALDNEYAAEIDRLRQLARVNPNVRSEEIEVLEAQAEAARHYLEGAQLKLDAVRVVIAT